MFREWSKDHCGRGGVEKPPSPPGQDSLLLSLLGADWFKNLTECLTHWLLNDSGQVLCLAGLIFFSPSSLNWEQHGEGLEKSEAQSPCCGNYNSKPVSCQHRLILRTG